MAQETKQDIAGTAAGGVRSGMGNTGSKAGDSASRQTKGGDSHNPNDPDFNQNRPYAKE